MRFTRRCEVKRTIYTVFLVGVCFAVGAGATTYTIPDDYPNVSDALGIVENGDTIQVRPGTYVDNGEWCANPEITGVKILGMGNSPSDVSITFPYNYTARVVILFAGYELGNMKLTKEIGASTEVIRVVSDCTDVSIHDLIITIPASVYFTTAIFFYERSSGEVSNCTVVGPEGEHKDKWGVSISNTAEVTSVSNFYFKNLKTAVGSGPDHLTTISYSCLENVDVPFDWGTDGPGNIFLAPGETANVDPVTCLPLYGSPLIDSGSPSLFDADGTRRDIGAVPRSQIVLLADWDSIPTTTGGGIGDPPRAYGTGDHCTLYIVVQKRTGLPNVDQVPTQCYLILDVYGEYYFWPSWGRDPDARTVVISDGYYTSECVLDFIWPAGVGSAYDLKFWAAPVWEGDTGTEHGPILQLSFGYST